MKKKWKTKLIFLITLILILVISYIISRISYSEINRINNFFSLNLPEYDKKIYTFENNGFGDSSWYYVFSYENPEKIKIIEDMKWNEVDKELIEDIQTDFESYTSFSKVKEQYRIKFDKNCVYEYYYKNPKGIENSKIKHFTYLFWFPDEKKLYIMGIEY